MGYSFRRGTYTCIAALMGGLATVASDLLIGEPEGWAFDATTEGGTVACTDTGTPANDLSDVGLNAFTFDDTALAAVTGSNITNAGTSPKQVRWNSDPYVRSTPHNMSLQSQTPATGTWTTANGTLTNNVGTAPDGTATAASFVENGLSAGHSATVGTTTVTGKIYNFSIYAKALGAGSTRYLGFTGVGLGTASEIAKFDVVNGTVDIPGTTVYFKSAAITSVGNGWYRCSIVVVANGTGGPAFELSDDATSNTSDTYAGDSTSGLLLWGAQTTEGAYLHPYHVTTTTAWYGVAQEYDGTRFGLLNERAATNLCLRSCEHDNASWTKTKITATDGQTAPDGTLTAELITVTGSSTAQLQSANITVSATSTYACSRYVKAGTGQWFSFDLVDGVSSNGARAWFDLVNGVVGTTSTFNASPYTNVSSAITSIGNGWYRCTIIATTNANTTMTFRSRYPDADNSFTDTANAAIGATYYHWGSQVELNNAPTSFIQTSAATVTRATDVLGALTSSYPDSDSEGTFIAWFKQGTVDDTSSSRIVTRSNGTTAERIAVDILSTDTPDSLSAFIVDNSVSQVAISPRTNISASGNKVAFAYKLNDCGYVADGGAEIADTAATMPTCTSMNIGYGGDFAGRIYQGLIYQLTYVPRRMLTADMQTRTGSSEGTAFGASYITVVNTPTVSGNDNTFSTVDFGAAHSTRKIYCVYNTRATTGRTISSATIGGVAATIHVQQVRTAVGADQMVGIFSADVPTGTSGDVVVTLSGTPPAANRQYLGVYRVLNQTGAVDDTDSVAAGAGSGTRTLNPTVVGGAVIAGCTNFNATDNTWTGPTENYDLENAGHAASQVSGALLTGVAGITQDVSVSGTSGSDIAFAAVAFH
jgi:hypothetical protein